MLHKVLLFNLALLFILATHMSYANVRISGGLGLGSSSSANEITQSEGPFTEAFTVEYLIHSRLAFGAEHIRSISLSPMSTGISFTGLYFKFYFNAAPTPYAKGDDVLSNELIFHDISYFSAVGLGIGQSNLLPNASNLSSNAAGVYISPRIGLETSVSRKAGLRGEMLIANSVFGKGTLSTFSLIGSYFYTF